MQYNLTYLFFSGVSKSVYVGAAMNTTGGGVENDLQQRRIPGHKSVLILKCKSLRCENTKQTVIIALILILGNQRCQWGNKWKEREKERDGKAKIVLEFIVL